MCRPDRRVPGIGGAVGVLPRMPGRHMYGTTAKVNCMEVGGMTVLLKEKKVLITGAGRGIGRQTAIVMAKEGAVVAGVGRSVRNLEGTAALVEKDGSRMRIAQLDVTSYEDAARVVPELAEKMGGLDVLVNCAAIFEEVPFTEMTPEQWQRTVSNDLTSVFNMTRIALAYIIEAKGTVINIGSQDAFYGCPGYSHYAACKAAVVGLTRSLARELGPQGVRVNCVAPGITETDMTRERIETGRQAYLDKLPVGRIGEPEDIANAVAFLASEKSSYITGQVIHCNGGMYLG